MQKRQTEEPGTAENHPEGNASPSPYDTLALKELAEKWRAEAARATLEAMRAFCLNEAEKCERRLQKSLSTPVIRGSETSEV